MQNKPFAMFICFVVNGLGVSNIYPYFIKFKFLEHLHVNDALFVLINDKSSRTPYETKTQVSFGICFFVTFMPIVAYSLLASC